MEETADPKKKHLLRLRKKDNPHGKTTEKHGNRRVMEDGTTLFKKAESTVIMEGIQFGLRVAIGGLTPKESNDILMRDFAEIDTFWCPSAGTSTTPAHNTADFTFKAYAPKAFRYFREAFGIKPDDFMLSLCTGPLKEKANPGASGSLFYLSPDDAFIIKTVQGKEAEFLRRLLPGYFLNVTQNTKTLLTKFFGLYCYKTSLGRNIRFVVMNNMLPTNVRFTHLFDLKGSTYKREASLHERAKACPTFKDLDFLAMYSDGLRIERRTYEALKRTLERDCRVLESFQLMDFSLLVGLHALTPASARELQQRHPAANAYAFHTADAMGLAKEDSFSGGMLAFTADGQVLLVFLGIIDLLQQYKLQKKMEHFFKSLIHDGKTISVCKPSFYSTRFQRQQLNKVFVPIDKDQADPLLQAFLAQAEADA